MAALESKSNNNSNSNSKINSNSNNKHNISELATYASSARHRVSLSYSAAAPPPSRSSPPPSPATPPPTTISIACPTHAALKLISKLRSLTRISLQAIAGTLLLLSFSNWLAFATAAATEASVPVLLHTTAAAPLTLSLSQQSSQIVDTAHSVQASVAPPNVRSLQLDAIFSAAINASGVGNSHRHHHHNSDNSNDNVESLPYSNGSDDGGGIGGSAASSTAISYGSNFGTNSVYDLFGAVFVNSTALPPTADQREEMDFTLPPFQAIVVSVVLLFVIIGTVVGNVLVCIAVCMVRKLRRPCNYLLVSLALSDLCVAVLVMPMALLYEVLEKWNFGPLLCDIWVSFDVLCCTASILNLCAISVDRYLAITKPLEYGVKRTPRRMMLCVALVWLAAACISLPPLLILGNEHIGENGEPICAVCQNFAYQIYATLGSFYIPLSVMLFVYYQIFRAAHRIVLEEKRAQTHLQHALNGTSAATQTANTDLRSGNDNGNGNGNGQRHSSYGNTSLTYSTCGVLSAHGAGSGGGVSGSSNLLSSPHQKKIRFQLAKEKKASTTLGIIMSAFTICWLPFFILALIRPFVESETTHVPQSLSSLFLWLGYANSLLNPIIYATLNRDFRKPFQAILYFRCSSLNTMMRENYYQDQYGEPPSQRVMLGDERHGARESFL